MGDEREATLKRVFFEQDQVRVCALQPAYPDVIVPGSVISLRRGFKDLASAMPAASHSPVIVPGPRSLAELRQLLGEKLEAERKALVTW